MFQAAFLLFPRMCLLCTNYLVVSHVDTPGLSAAGQEQSRYLHLMGIDRALLLPGAYDRRSPSPSWSMLSLGAILGLESRLFLSPWPLLPTYERGNFRSPYTCKPSSPPDRPTRMTKHERATDLLDPSIVLAVHPLFKAKIRTQHLFTMSDLALSNLWPSSARVQWTFLYF